MQCILYLPSLFVGYPWDTMADQDITNFGLKKWLFLSDYPQMLDKNILYGELIFQHTIL